MIVWFKNLPEKDIDYSKWVPFIKSTWIRKNFIKFAYLLMFVLFILPNFFKYNTYRNHINNTFSNFMNNSIIASISSILYVMFIILTVYVLHELLHIVVIYKKCDISITYNRGIFLWITPNDVLQKKQFWLFMSLPIIGLSIVPSIVSVLINGYFKSLLLYICWVNLIIGSADIINSILILIKPNNTLFYRGRYRVE